MVDRPHPMGGPSAVALLALLRTIRGPMADRLQDISVAELISAEPLVKNSINGGPFTSYTRIVCATKFLTALNFANFHNSNLNLGSLLI